MAALNEMAAQMAEMADHVAAVCRGDEVAVRVWLEGGGRANATRERRGEDGEVTTGVTLLMDAALEGHERVVEVLLQHGAEANVQDSFGETALMRAANGRYMEIVTALTKAGACT